MKTPLEYTALPCTDYRVIAFAAAARSAAFMVEQVVDANIDTGPNTCTLVFFRCLHALRVRYQYGLSNRLLRLLESTRRDTDGLPTRLVDAMRAHAPDQGTAVRVGAACAISAIEENIDALSEIARDDGAVPIARIIQALTEVSVVFHKMTDAEISRWVSETHPTFGGREYILAGADPTCPIVVVSPGPATQWVPHSDLECQTPALTALIFEALADSALDVAIAETPSATEREPGPPGAGQAEPAASS